MLTFFVIGNIASGKSCASRYLESRGGFRIDLDQLAKELYAPGSSVVDEIADAFGSDVLDPSGGIDTRRLSDRAFSCPENVERLNSIVYPVLLERLGNLLVEPVACSPVRSNAAFNVVEISVAASFTQAFPLADEIIAITAPVEVRRARAIDRGMTGDEFDRRAALQPSEEEICSLASCVIDNTECDDSLFEGLEAFLERHGIGAPGQERLDG